MNRKLLPITVYYFVVFIVLVILGITFGLFPSFPETYNISSFTFSSLRSFAGGFLLAGLFFILLRPRVKISPQVSKRVDHMGEQYFTFKFINNSFFAAFDVNIEAYLCENVNATGTGSGKHVKHNAIELTRKKWIHFPGWRPVMDRTIYAPHCITVRTLDSTLEDKIRDNADYVEFRVTLKHAFSNLSSTYRIRYMNEDFFGVGKFHFGNTFKIV